MGGVAFNRSADGKMLDGRRIYILFLVGPEIIVVIVLVTTLIIAVVDF